MVNALTKFIIKSTTKLEPISVGTKFFPTNNLETEYVELFKSSDALIHDCGSFMAEYLVTNKPVLFLEKNNYKIEELDKQDGDEAGIKSVMIRVIGKNAYGYLKHERGVHRLVRISPFDSNKRRHTSFAAVEITPEVDDTVEVDINPNDLKIDIFRSSGPGGQGVNTTDSAVRITHLPTKIVVTCQNERSQIQNKEHCIQVLMSKLYALEMSKKDEELASISGEKVANAFGSGKRSYVMCPYTRVVDNESGYETVEVDKVLDGEIDEFISNGLRV